MSSLIRPWPYAATAINQYEWLGDRLAITITFRHPMDVDVVPAGNLFSFWIDGASQSPAALSWRNAYTLNTQIFNILAHPSRVLSSYAGPNENLRTTWGKQWEPWNYLYCQDVPYNWEHILDVDVDNARVNINGVLALSTKIITPGTYNNMDISDVNVLFLNCAAGAIVLQGFIGGIVGQYLKIARISNAAQNTTLVHAHIPATQKLLLHAGINETLNGEFGGWTLICDGSLWYDVSHAKHV